MKKIINFLRKIGVLHISGGTYSGSDVGIETRLDRINTVDFDKKKNKKEKKSFSGFFSLWFWIILLSVLFLFVLYLIFNIPFLIFLIFVILLGFLIRWVFFRGFLLWIRIAISLFFILIFSFVMTLFRPANTATTQKLEIQVIDSPKVIDCYRSSDEIKLKIKNLASDDFSYSDVQTGKYEFGICDGDIDTTETISCHISPANVSILDFGTIKPNEEKEVVIKTTGESKSNALTEFKKTKINGDYNYFVDISLIKNKKLKPVIGKSNIFSVHTNIMNDKNEYLKDCDN